MAIKLSIITCTYNSMPLLNKCVASVNSALAQFDHSVEWIIVDGKSTDGSLDAVNSCHKVRKFSRPPGGIYDALNFAVSVAEGEFVAYVHSDDEIDSGFFRSSHLLHDRAHPRINCEYGKVTFIDAGSETLYSRYPPHFFEALNRRTNLIFHPNAIWRRSHEKAHTYRLNVGPQADWHHTRKLTRNSVLRNSEMEYLFRISAASTTRNNVLGRKKFPMWNVLILTYETQILKRIWRRLRRKTGFWTS